MHILSLVTDNNPSCINQRREENDRRNYFMINLYESMVPAGIKLATPGSAVRHASVTRHVTDCATRPGKKICEIETFQADMSYPLITFTTCSV